MFQEINKKLISTCKMTLEALNKEAERVYLFLIDQGFMF